MKTHSNKGKVKWFKKDKGFGFILDEKTGKDIFVHATGLEDEITEGDDVVFNLKDGKKGINAVEVQLI